MALVVVVAQGRSPTIDFGQSIAGPRCTNSNKTVTVHLKPGWKWSDGTPITSQDLAFDYWVLEGAVNKTVGGSPANYGDYTPGLYPDDVTSVPPPTPARSSSISTRATTRTSSSWRSSGPGAVARSRLGQDQPHRPIIPFNNLKNAAAIYKFLNAQSDKLSTYGSNPLWQVVDGPFKVKSFDPATDGNTLVADPAYTGPVKPHLAGIDDLAFTSTSSEFDQLLTGELDVGFIDFSDLPQVPAWCPRATASSVTPTWLRLRGLQLQGPDGRLDHIISQLTSPGPGPPPGRASGDQSRGLYNGAAGRLGPVPAIPVSPFTPSNALSNPYPFASPRPPSS